MTTITCKFIPTPKPAPGRKVKPPTRSRQPRTDPARIARMLALAHHVEREIARGTIADYSSAASALGVTRARLSQVMSLLLLAPDLQERIAVGEISVSERNLRAAVATPDWSRQRVAIDTVALSGSRACGQPSSRNDRS